MPRPIKSQVFRGKRYRVEFLNECQFKDGGECHAPYLKGKKMTFRKKYSSDKNELEAYIHEPLHSMMWDLDEEAILEMGENLTNWLWRLGYRKVGNNGDK